MKRKNINFARNLRKNQTIQERRVWNLLKNKNMSHKFRRQHSVGNYIVDFCCLEKGLVIELDGGQHNETGKIKEDIDREKFLIKNGYRILRFWNNDIDKNIDGVYQKILEVLSYPPPHPTLSPRGRGE